MVLISGAIALLLPLAASAKFTLKLTRPTGADIRNASATNAQHAPVGLAHSGFVNLPAFNWEFAYSINCTIGTPGQPMTLIFDSGSSNIIIPSKQCSSLSCGSPAHFFDQTKSTTFNSTGKAIDIYYGTGDAHGVIASDVLNLGGLKIQNQGIGVMTEMAAVITQMGNDGIIGFGPDSGSEGNVPTPLTVMYQQGLISSKMYSIFFQPVPNGQHVAVNGEITFGGVDDTNIAEPMSWVPVSTNKEVDGFWGVDADAFYAGSKKISGKVSGFVDTGTTLVNVAPTIGDAFFNAISGSKRDEESGMYSVPCSKLDSLPDFTISIGGKLYSLTGRQYVIPSYENPDYSQSNTALCLSFIQPTDSGFSFILGAKWLEHFVAGFDAGANKIGFAPVKGQAPPVSSATSSKTTSTKKPTTTKKSTATTEKPATKHVTTTTKHKTTTKHTTTKKTTTTKHVAAKTTTTKHAAAKTTSHHSTHKTTSKKTTAHKSAKKVVKTKSTSHKPTTTKHKSTPTKKTTSKATSKKSS